MVAEALAPYAFAHRFRDREGDAGMGGGRDGRRVGTPQVAEQPLQSLDLIEAVFYRAAARTSWVACTGTAPRFL
jgi:hypothetical protein